MIKQRFLAFGLVYFALFSWQPAFCQNERSNKELEAEATVLRDELFKLQSLGDNEGAIPKAERLLKICKKLFGEHHPTVTNVTSTLTDLYKLTGRTETAKKLQQQSSTKESDFSFIMPPEIQISIVAVKSYYERRDFPSAAKEILKAKRKLESLKLYRGVAYAVVINELGRIEEALNKIDLAESNYRLSISIAEENGMAGRQQLAVTLNNLGLLLSKRERYNDAEKMLKRSLAIDKELNTHRDVASALTVSNIGLVNSHLGRSKEAIKWYLNASNIIVDIYGDKHPKLIKIYDNLANEAWKTGDTTAMLRWQKQANDVMAKAIADTIVLGSEQQKRRYMARFNNMSYATISRSFDVEKDHPLAGQVAFESILLRKSRVMDSISGSLERLRSNQTKSEASALNEYMALQKAKADWYYSTTRHQENLVTNTATILNREEKLEKFLGSRNTQFRALVRDISSKDISQSLPPQSVLLEFVVYTPWRPEPDSKSHRITSQEPRYAVYGLTRSGKIRWWDLGEKQALERIISDFQSGLSNPSHTYVKTKSKELFRKVMSPMQNFLQGIDTIFIAPDGALNLIPFGALIDSSGHYLAQSYRAINYLSSGRELIRNNHTAKVNEIVIVADPDYGQLKSGLPNACTSKDRRSTLPISQGFERLCGTRLEADAISNIFPRAQVISDRNATETSIKSLQSPGILHLATHGFYLADLLPAASANRSPSPLSSIDETLLRSGLIFAGANQRDSGNDDGVLTALEAIGLNLTNSRLVVLSACESGLGEVALGEGVFGLRRALTMAGAETQVMSLWKVSDSVTANIMARYYELLVSGLGRGEALLQVQKEFLQQHKGEEAHPYYWAAFISSGDWRQLSFH